MASFSAGWQSYSFKSTIRSRFGSKDGKVSRPPAPTVPPNASFHEGVATKDVNINDETGLTVRIYLPACCIQPGKINEFGWMMKRMGTSQEWLPKLLSPPKAPHGNASDISDSSDRAVDAASTTESSNEQFWQGVNGHDGGPESGAAAGEAAEAANGARMPDAGGGGVSYTGYIPKFDAPNNHRLPVIVQFHAGAFVMGSKDSPCNDVLCRRLARVCNAIVIAVGYRLAPEHKCPSAYDDGFEVLKWLARQALLGEVERDQVHLQQQQQHQHQQGQMGQGQAGRGRGQEVGVLGLEPMSGGREAGTDRQAGRGGASGSLGVDGDEEGQQHGDGSSEEEGGTRGLGMGLLQEVADPWLAVHADVSRCMVLGVSAGGNIADQVTRRACTPQGVNDLNPLVLVGQVLLYPLFGGSMRTPSETKNKDSYFFDVATCELAFRLLLPVDEFSMDHPAVNPMLREQLPPGMPPTLLVVADHDMLTDRAIAYSVFLRNYGVDVQVNSYKDVVHGFASYHSMVHTPQAEACVEDIAMWVAKHVSSRGSELSY